MGSLAPPMRKAQHAPAPRPFRPSTTGAAWQKRTFVLFDGLRQRRERNRHALRRPGRRVGQWFRRLRLSATSRWRWLAIGADRTGGPVDLTAKGNSRPAARSRLNIKRRLMSVAVAGAFLIGHRQPDAEPEIRVMPRPRQSHLGAHPSSGGRPRRALHAGRCSSGPAAVGCTGARCGGSAVRCRTLEARSCFQETSGPQCLALADTTTVLGDWSRGRYRQTLIQAGIAALRGPGRAAPGGSDTAMDSGPTVIDR